MIHITIGGADVKAAYVEVGMSFKRLGIICYGIVSVKRRSVIDVILSSILVFDKRTTVTKKTEMIDIRGYLIMSSLVSIRAKITCSKKILR